METYLIEKLHPTKVCIRIIHCFNCITSKDVKVDNIRFYITKRERERQKQRERKSQREKKRERWRGREGERGEGDGREREK